MEVVVVLLLWTWLGLWLWFCVFYAVCLMLILPCPAIGIVTGRWSSSNHSAIPLEHASGSDSHIAARKV